MTSHPAATDRARTASIPWALRNVAEFLMDSGLHPLEVSASSRRDAVVIYVDARESRAWIEAFAKPLLVTSRDTPLGTHHEANGILADVAVSVRWFKLANPAVEAERLRLAAEHADAFHVECEGNHEAPGHVTLCLDDAATGPHDGTVERACGHGRDLCDECRGACSECVDDGRQDVAAGHRS